MELTDLFLLIMIGLSFLAGYVRGLSEEILRLAAYFLSGVLGCLFLPEILPFFSVVPGDAAQRALALFSGTFIAWILLKMTTAIITRKIRKSRFKKLDKSLGLFFGGARAGFLLFVFGFVCMILEPRFAASSRILTLSGKGISFLFNAFPEYKNFEPEKNETEEAEEWTWKEKLLHYLQNTTVGEGEEKTTLLSYIASTVVNLAPREELYQEYKGADFDKGGHSDKASEGPKGDYRNFYIEGEDKTLITGSDLPDFSSREIMVFSPKLFEEQITSWLKGKKFNSELSELGVGKRVVEKYYSDMEKIETEDSKIKNKKAALFNLKGILSQRFDEEIEKAKKETKTEKEAEAKENTEAKTEKEAEGAEEEKAEEEKYENEGSDD